MSEEYSREELAGLARQTLAELPARGVIWLSGDLGSGKTTFAHLIVTSAGASGATSPTFSLVHEYDSPSGVIYHVDCFRLRAPEEAMDLALDELVEGARLMMIEWPDRASRVLPQPDVHLRFDHAADPERRVVRRLT